MEHPLLRGRVGIDRGVAKAAIRLLELTRETSENAANPNDQGDPMIRQHTCYIAECDTPGCKPFDDAEYTPHFDSPEQAISRLVADWEWTDEDGKLRCRDCSRRHQCEQTSHDWYDPNSSEDLLQFTREYCRRCPETRSIRGTATA